jgi:hypothetical protein
LQKDALNFGNGIVPGMARYTLIKSGLDTDDYIFRRRAKIAGHYLPLRAFFLFSRYILCRTAFLRFFFS